MSRTTIVALAWALVHFIWQGAALGLAAGFAGVAMRKARPALRYAVFSAALGAMAVLPVVTFVVMRAPSIAASAPGTTAAPAATAAVTTPPARAAASPAVRSTATPLAFDWLVGIWLSGVVLLGLRGLSGWAWAQRLKRFQTSPAAATVRNAAGILAERLGMRRAVRILMTAATDVPATLGWLKPVILVPISAFTALTAEQIELLIAHELAHVRRHDYLVNLVQTAVETVLFYHPAVWWVSGRIRDEREHCCDDLAVHVCGNVDSYVRALAALEGMRSARSAMVVAANGGSLLARIQRLLNHERRPLEAPPAWLGALVPAALVLGAMLSSPPPAAAGHSQETKSRPEGFLGGLTDAGYTHLSVDEIIALKEHGVEPLYVKNMLGAGLGVPDVSQLIRLREHGVQPEFAASMAMSGLVSDLDFETVVTLRENDVRGDDLLRIRALGFGPFSARDVIRLRQNGVDAGTFAALKEAGAVHAGPADAVEFRQNDVTVDRIRDMNRQGFNNLSVEQILKLRRSGII